MEPHVFETAAGLSDADLLAKVKQLAAREREAMVALIAHLAELDARRLYLAEGYPSLFAYCTQALHLSEHAAYGRIEAARAARRAPVILDRLADGSLTLTAVCLLAPHLTPGNHEEVLEAARWATKRQVEELVARLRPQPDVPPSIRRLPMKSSPVSSGPSAVATGDTAVGESRPLPPPIASPSRDRPTIVPLAPERYRVQCTVSAATYQKLRLAQDLLRHQIPDGNVEQILDRALTVLLRDLSRQKQAATARPREARDAGPRSRHIPAEVRRKVWMRDGGQCAFVGRNGRRCAERGFLEFHHVKPHAAGGGATVENIELCCRAHSVPRRHARVRRWKHDLT